jgi:hypothetical protein
MSLLAPLASQCRLEGLASKDVLISGPSGELNIARCRGYAPLCRSGVYAATVASV